MTTFAVSFYRFHRLQAHRCVEGVGTPPFLLDFGAWLLLGDCKKTHNSQRHNELQEQEYKHTYFCLGYAQLFEFFLKILTIHNRLYLCELYFRCKKS